MAAALPEEVRQAAGMWPAIVGAVSDGLLKHYLKLAMVSVSDLNELLLIYDEQDKTQAMAAQYMEMGDALELTAQTVANEVGKYVPVKVALNRTPLARQQAYPDIVNMIIKAHPELMVSEEDEEDEEFF